MRKDSQMWALTFFWKGNKRHALLVFNPRLTPLISLLSDAVILTYICQSSATEKGQCGASTISSLCIQSTIWCASIFSEILEFTLSDRSKCEKYRIRFSTVTIVLNGSGKFIDKLVVLQGVVLLLPQPGLNVCVAVWPTYVEVWQRHTHQGVLLDNCEKFEKAGEKLYFAKRGPSLQSFCCHPGFDLHNNGTQRHFTGIEHYGRLYNSLFLKQHR